MVQLMQGVSVQFSGGTGPPTGQPARPGIPRGFANTNSNGNTATGSANIPGNSNGFGNSGTFASARDVNQRNCTNCGQSGHYNMDCPRNQQGRTQNRVQDRRRNDASVPPGRTIWHFFLPCLDSSWACRIDFTRSFSFQEGRHDMFNSNYLTTGTLVST